MVTTTDRSNAWTSAVFGATLAPLVLLAWLPLQLFSGQFLRYAIVFFVLAILAALVGARGVAGVSMEVARIFVLLFIILAIITLVL